MSQPSFAILTSHCTLAGFVAGLVAAPDKLHVVPEQHLVVPAHGHEDAGTVHQTNCNSEDIVIHLYLSLDLNSR